LNGRADSKSVSYQSQLEEDAVRTTLTPGCVRRAVIDTRRTGPTAFPQERRTEKKTYRRTESDLSRFHDTARFRLDALTGNTSDSVELDALRAASNMTSPFAEGNFADVFHLGTFPPSSLKALR